MVVNQCLSRDNLFGDGGRIENKREIEKLDPLISLSQLVGLDKSFRTLYSSNLYDNVFDNFFYDEYSSSAQLPPLKKGTSECFRKIPKYFLESLEPKLVPGRVSAALDHSSVRGWSKTTTKF